MNNQAWECPRCGRMNAPFNPSCFCNKDYKPFNPVKFSETDDLVKNGRCSNCGGFHGMWQGRSVNCVDLKTVASMDWR